MKAALRRAYGNPHHGRWCSSATFNEFLPVSQRGTVATAVIGGTPALCYVDELRRVAVERPTSSTPRHTVTLARHTAFPILKAHALSHATPYNANKMATLARQ